MPGREFSRADRVRKAMMREVSDIIAHRIKNPALNNILISVTDVEVSHDLSHARIFISVMADEPTRQTVMNIITEATPQIRTEIGQRIRLRHTPSLDIRYDDSLERGSRITELLNQISKDKDV